MEAEGRRRLGRAFADSVAMRRAVDMRYGEQIFEIGVSLEGIDLGADDLIDQVVERFQRRHEALYTYSAPGQDIVLVNARVTAVGELPVTPVEPQINAAGRAAPTACRSAYLGAWVEVPVYRWDALAAGSEIPGPALFESATTTVLARSGERVQVTPHGWLDIRLG
jgi:N-methylhydantoinase A